MIKEIKADFIRYWQIEYGSVDMSFLKKMRLWYHSYGLQVLAAYRFYQWSITGTNIPLKISKLPLACIAFTLYKFSEKLYNIYISPHAKIEGGCYIGHFGGIRIGRCQIGSLCNINHQVTIGEFDGKDSSIRVVIGERVWIGAHSSIKGFVRIGDGVTISAGSIITEDLENNLLVAGPSARVLKKDYDNAMLLGLTKVEK